MMVQSGKCLSFLKSRIFCSLGWPRALCVAKDDPVLVFLSLPPTCQDDKCAPRASDPTFSVGPLQEHLCVPLVEPHKAYELWTAHRE